MAQQTVTAYIHMQLGYHAGPDGKKDWSRQTWAPSIWDFQAGNDETRQFISAQQVTIEVPDDFNPIPGQVAALEAEKAKALAAYQQSVADINERWSKLLAITNEIAA